MHLLPGCARRTARRRDRRRARRSPPHRRTGGHRRPDYDGWISEQASGELAGVYRIRFYTATCFAGQSVAAFYPEIVFAFETTDPAGEYHVPLLLSPYAYSAYRES